jgi:DNA-binding NarL/FixJ family response regulator
VIAPSVEEYAQLSEREREVLALLGQGCTNQEIAERCCVSFKTARTHVTNIMTKLELHNRTQAAIYAVLWERECEGKLARTVSAITIGERHAP